MGLADDKGDAQLLQVHGDEHRGRQIVANGNDGAVHIPDPQGPEDLLILGIPHYGVGHFAGHLLHQVSLYIQGQYLRPQLAQLPGQRGSKPAQADHNIGFHIFPP